MNEKDRYNKPKKINDILKDMKMDPESIQAKMDVTTTTVTDHIIINLERHLHCMNKIHPIYERASALLYTIEKYYTHLYAYIRNHKQKIKTHTVPQYLIDEHIHSIQKDVDVFLVEYEDIANALDTMIDEFDDVDHAKQQIKKSVAFCDLFIAISNDIDDLCLAYKEMV